MIGSAAFIGLLSRLHGNGQSTASAGSEKVKGYHWLYWLIDKLIKAGAEKSTYAETYKMNFEYEDLEWWKVWKCYENVWSACA